MLLRNTPDLARAVLLAEVVMQVKVARTLFFKRNITIRPTKDYYLLYNEGDYYKNTTASNC